MLGRKALQQEHCGSILGQDTESPTASIAARFLGMEQCCPQVQ